MLDRHRIHRMINDHRPSTVVEQIHLLLQTGKGIRRTVRRSRPRQRPHPSVTIDTANPTARRR
jgi:hypothetical protein